jgi:hypothetical protein
MASPDPEKPGRPRNGPRLCHRAIHAAIDNKALARVYADSEALRAHPDIARFLGWVKDKDPDFHAPTRRRRA